MDKSGMSCQYCDAWDAVGDGDQRPRIGVCTNVNSGVCGVAIGYEHGTCPAFAFAPCAAVARDLKAEMETVIAEGE